MTAAGTVVTVACPSGPLGAGVGAGLGAACQAASAAGAAAGSVATHALGSGATSVLDAMARWVASGAVWLLGRVAGLLDATTRVDLGAAWFTSHLAVMAGLAGTVVLPLLALGVVQALHAQSAVLLVRTALVNVPAALVLTGVAVKLVTVGLVVTDAMSAAVAGGDRADTAHVLSRVVIDLDTAALGGQAGVPAFLALVAALVVVLAAFAVWVELLLRAAALSVAVLFLPLALASLAWPAISHWCRRLAESIAALVIAKFVVVAVLSLGTSALAAGAGAGAPSGATSLVTVLAAAALLLLASLSPWAVLRLLPFAEAAAVAHLEGVGQRGVRTVLGAPRTLAHAALGASALASATSSRAGPAALAGALAAAGPGSVDGSPGSPWSPDGPPAAPGDAPADEAGNGGEQTSPDGAGASHRPGSHGVQPGSTWARAGVGAGLVPGGDVPLWAPHPGASAALRDALAGIAGNHVPADAGTPARPPGPGSPVLAGRGGTPPPAGGVTAPAPGGAGEQGSAATPGGAPGTPAPGGPTAWIAHDHLGPVLVSTAPFPPLDDTPSPRSGPGIAPAGGLPVEGAGTAGGPRGTAGAWEDLADDGDG